MMPMHMDSSNLRHMRPQRYPYYQGFGNNPQHMTMDAPSPVPCGNWPAPSQCYGGCIPPAYSPYWPCYPPRLPHHPCCVNHSGFHPVHHASHAPPCYSYQPFPVGYEPRYDYEEGPGKHLCMKCSPKVDGGIVIEEQEPEMKKGNNGEAVVPVRSTDCPYPIIWIPHENAKNQGQGNGSQEEPPAENMKIQKNEPKFWNGYFPLDESTMKPFIKNQDGQKKQGGETVEFPFDINKLKSLLQGQDGKDDNREASGQFPYPIIWIPSHGKPEEGKERVGVEASEGQARSDEGRSFPSDKHVNNAQHGGKKGNSDGNVCSDNKERRSVRNIPVRLSEDHLQKPTEPTKRVANETGENARTEKSSSPPKASKLPPVCLRVDPLPSKRRTGGSKSLSPPRRKEETLTSEEHKVPSTRSSKAVETKTIPVACNVKCEEKKHPNAAGREKEAVESKMNMQKGANTEVVKPQETKEYGEKTVKVSFTEEEAARTIQSMYRGYDVRRRESLKKLKQIAKIREKMGAVKKRIQTLEVSVDQNIEGKEFIAVGEMVMSLILELDSIQGLHPSIRDFRKSLARELLDMQESVDSLKKKKAGMEEEALRKKVETSMDEAGKDSISQTNGNPVTSDTRQLEEAKQMLSDPGAENCSVLLPSTGEHPMNVMNRKHEEVDAEEMDAGVEEGSGLSETLVEDLQRATEADGCEVDDARPTGLEKVEEIETVVPVTPPSADGKGKIVTNSEKVGATEESLESPHGLAQESESQTDGYRVCSLQGIEGQEIETKVSENVDKTTVTDASSPSQNDAQHSGLSVGMIEEEAQYPLHSGVQVPPYACESVDTSPKLLPQEEETRAASIQLPEQEVEQKKEEEHRAGLEDSFADESEGTDRTNYLKNIIENFGGARELSKAATTAMDFKIQSQESHVDHSDHTKGSGQKTAEPELPELETEQASEIEVCKYEPDQAGAAPIDHETQDQGTDIDLSTDRSKDISQETAPGTEVREYELSRADTTVIDPETESQETEAGHSTDQSKGTDQNNHEPKEEPEEVPGAEQIPESEVSGHETSEETKKLMEENQRLRETMEKLVSAGREQLEIISNLTGRVKSLEKKLSQRNTTKVGRHKTCRTKHTSKPNAHTSTASASVM